MTLTSLASRQRALLETLERIGGYQRGATPKSSAVRFATGGLSFDAGYRNAHLPTLTYKWTTRSGLSGPRVSRNAQNTVMKTEAELRNAT